ncbi:MAG: hypothetical protein ABMA02_12205 [Saprospiraceae bacterium]
MVFAVIVAAIVAYLIFADVMEARNSNHSNSQGQPSHAHPNLMSYNNPYYQPGPVFSPTRRYVWDGEKWVRNETYFGAGFALGLLFGIGLLAYILIF